MKTFVPSILNFLLFCLYHHLDDAFVVVVPASSTLLRLANNQKKNRGRSSSSSSTLPVVVLPPAAAAAAAAAAPDEEGQHPLKATKNVNDDSDTKTVSPTANAVFPRPPFLTHRDVIWKLRPPPDYPWRRRIRLRWACTVLRLTSLLQRKELPVVLCPWGGQAMLECYLGRTKVGKVGFTTQPGPSIPQLQETVAQWYGRVDNPAPALFVSAAALIYMYVEPPYRGRNLGALALEAVSFVHACQNVDFTVLVANDASNPPDELKLVQWYEKHGFVRAPLLQDVFGSPNGVYGIAMIAPTNSQLPDGCRIEWW